MAAREDGGPTPPAPTAPPHTPSLKKYSTLPGYCASSFVGHAMLQRSPLLNILFESNATGMSSFTVIRTGLVLVMERLPSWTVSERRAVSRCAPVSDFRGAVLGTKARRGGAQAARTRAAAACRMVRGSVGGLCQALCEL